MTDQFDTLRALMRVADKSNTKHIMLLNEAMYITKRNAIRNEYRNNSKVDLTSVEQEQLDLYREGVMTELSQADKKEVVKEAMEKRNNTREVVFLTIDSLISL